MTRISMLITLVAALALQGCARPDFVMPDQPALGDPMSPPPTPQAKALPVSVQLPISVDAVGIPERGKPSAPLRLAILPVSIHPSVDALGPSASERLEDLFPRVLLESGLSHFVGPDVLMAVPAEKTAVRDGTVRWNAPLGTLMQVEPVIDADLMLQVEVRHAKETHPQLDVHFSLDPDELKAYSADYAAWKETIESAMEAIKTQKKDYDTAFNKAKAEYEGSRGKYEGRKEATPGDLALVEYQDISRRLDARQSALEQALSDCPSPDDLEKSVGERVEKKHTDAVELAVRVRIVDARSLEVQWIGDLETRDETLSAGGTRLLERFLDEVKPGT